MYSVRFLNSVSKLSITLLAYIALALLLGGSFKLHRYTLLNATLSLL